MSKHTKILKLISGFCLFFLIFLLPVEQDSQAQEPASVPVAALDAIRARQIGPATMSGRIAAIDAVDSRPVLLYVGAAGGGVWKSANGGVQFKPVFDKYVQSVGAIRIDPNHPDTVWVGTGEPWTRNSTSVGYGVYKTTDGGDSWKKTGLENTERIGRILINPSDPDVVYVAALGHLWDANQERGLFKTSDGGKTWEKILYVDENTGCADIAMDPGNPDVIYAGMWDFRRQPWTFRSGGPGSGLYKTVDGGKNWTKLTKGLPEGTLGRIAVSVSPVSPNLVYALVESKKSALYRSFDYGDSWTKINTTIPARERPFYFSNIIADPVDTNRVYKPGFNMHVSDNQGKNFRVTYLTGGKIHPDMHALWVSKRNNHLLYAGTDGGVYVSGDQGSSWSLLRNLPVSQFYHVAVDNEKPYNVYGGLQDNGSWYGPSEKSGGITNADWKNAGFGDGFSMIPDRTDNNIVYWQFQGGQFFRYYKKTGEIKLIKPFPDLHAQDLRFNWNAGISQSPTRDVLYVGAQYLFQSYNRGDTWKRISGDLTTNDPEKLKQYETGGLTLDNSTAENHCTIITIAESPKNHKVIWVGTDDGNLQVTRDEGATWTNVVKNIPGLPEHTWCSKVLPGNFDEGIAYVTFDGHRTGDKNPYVFKTNDFGLTWKTLGNSTIESYCQCILQDPVNSKLLFLGTEFGLYVSFNDGESWTRMRGNIPKVSVRDMVIQTRESDLVLATHGRGILVIDDITTLRKFTPETMNREVAFLPSRPFVIGKVNMNFGFAGDDEYIGPNPPDAATITYYLKKRHIFGDMHLEIYDKDGKQVKKLPAGKRKGINRVSWTVMKKPPKVPSSPSIAQFAMFGPFYDPGTYTVKLIKGKSSYEGSVTLLLDPDSPYSMEDRTLRLKTVNQGYDMLEELAYINEKAVRMSKKTREYSKVMKGSLRKKALKMADELDQLHHQMVATKMGGITGEEKLREKIVFLYATTILYRGKPTRSQIDGLNILKKEMGDIDGKVDQKIKDNLSGINAFLVKKGKEPIHILTREAYDKESENL